MIAVKGNKEIKIVEIQKDDYIKNGYTILDDTLKVIARPNSRLENLKAENEKLKKEIEQLKGKNAKNSDIEKIIEENKDLNNQISDLKATIETLKAENEKLKKK